MKQINWSKILKISFPYLWLTCLILGWTIIPNSASEKKRVLEIGIPGGTSVKVNIENEQIKLQDIVREIEKNSKEEKALLLELKDRNIYKIHDDELVDALEEVPFSQEVSQKIRNLWKESKGPFDYQKNMTIVVDRTLSNKQAKVCKHSLFTNDQRLVVISNNSKNMVSVTVKQVDSSCNVKDQDNNLIISSDIAKQLQIEESDSFIANAKVDALFDNPRNALIVINR